MTTSRPPFSLAKKQGLITILFAILLVAKIVPSQPALAKRYGKAESTTILTSREKAKSSLSAAFSRMGISDIAIEKLNRAGSEATLTLVPARERQLALITNLYLMGAFDRSVLREVVEKMGPEFGHLKKSSKEALKHIDSIMSKALAYQGIVSRFNPDFILDHLFHSHIFDLEDIEDFIFLLTQITYPKPSQDSLYLIGTETIAPEVRKRIIDNFQSLGFITRFSVSKNCHAAFVLGASREAYTERVFFLKNIKGGVKIRKVAILTGNRRLSAEVDGIGGNLQEKILDGLKYISALARKNKVKPGPGNLFIEERAPSGRTFTYWNDNGTVNETMMSADVYLSVIGAIPDFIFDTPAPEGKTRPDTIDTINYAMQSYKKLFEGVEDPRIVVVSNQPYILRQTAAIERTMQETLRAGRLGNIKKIDIIPSGLGINSSLDSHQLTTIHAEIVAFVSEKYMQIAQNKNRKRKPTELLQVAKLYRDVFFEKKQIQKKLLTNDVKKKEEKSLKHRRVESEKILKKAA